MDRARIIGVVIVLIAAAAVAVVLRSSPAEPSSESGEARRALEVDAGTFVETASAPSAVTASAAPAPSTVEAFDPEPAIAEGTAAPSTVPVVDHAARVTLMAQRLAESPNPQERVNAVSVLAVERAPESVAALTGALHDESPRVRMAAAMALRRVGGVRGLDAVGTALESEEDPTARRVLEAVLATPLAPSPSVPQ